MPRRRKRGAVLCGFVALAFVACGGATSQHLPDDVLAGAGGTGTGVVLGGSDGGGATPVAGKPPATSGASSGSPPDLPGFGGAPPNIPSFGGAPPDVPGSGGAAVEAGGAPPDAPSRGGAPSCDSFEDAWQGSFCDKYSPATPSPCADICNPPHLLCTENCNDCADCTTPQLCAACRAANRACRLRCVRLLSACRAKCSRLVDGCAQLQSDYPDCSPPTATAP